MYKICGQMQAELSLPAQRLVWHRSMLFGKLDPAVSRDTLGCKLCHNMHFRFTSRCASAAGVCREEQLFDVVAWHQLAIKALFSENLRQLQCIGLLPRTCVKPVNSGKSAYPFPSCVKSEKL